MLVCTMRMYKDILSLNESEDNLFLAKYCQPRCLQYKRDERVGLLKVKFDLKYDAMPVIQSDIEFSGKLEYSNYLRAV